VYVEAVRAPQYHEREKRTGWGATYAPCLLCGRRVEDDAPGGQMVELLVGGELLRPTDPRAGKNVPSSQGYYRVGADCARRLRRLFAGGQP